MSIKRRILQAWTWMHEPLTQGRLFLLSCSLVIFCLVAEFGYAFRPRLGEVCVFNNRAFICRLLFFCTFTTMVTCLVFLGLDPYLPSIPVRHYLRIICLIDLVTAGLWLFIWIFGSFLLLEQWIQTEPGTYNVHSSRSIIGITFSGAACWVLMVVYLTKRLKEVNSMEDTQIGQGYGTEQSPASMRHPWSKPLATGAADRVTQSV